MLMNVDADWDLGEGLDPEGPSGADLDRFGDELMRCKRCGAQMYDQATVCHECGEYVVEGEKSLSVWMILGVIGLVVLFLVVVI
ncbi:MAG: hypothetical protein JKY43_02180 [Phycisphaerales bacterium]|nr:hypothetical protein [Phycisphaerales bacterium]